MHNAVPRVFHGITITLTYSFIWPMFANIYETHDSIGYKNGCCLEDTKRYIIEGEILRNKQILFVANIVKYVYQGNWKHWNVKSKI